ncbi:MAG: MerR family transcriptional regulator [Lachnospiraceae bacterium]|uniref:MerR family transcriptional regulator n=1 Tax=Candidatus Merdisoma sp. JLR.KK011 TaxID=3114299 RepID=UPI001433C1AE|nr:MerR family transcriptional regulator [Lachnospiraceae bacterium]MCI9383029.1 MerR family transcriptional regulator [Lachnospiraceae bacterium]MCI9478914.1 MerR family transcriptional regulator [Lachnospiraceae bacterium]MCI9622761.1 MerR family transcriptional regulator [Lachnospiraceae bacterium]GFI10336.1 putative HTH-type transcriptional regulator [Lachnospiraceae bacterium]
MGEVRYMISDAARLVDVEAHVLRYWEEELELPIGRNEMGHRYYTEENVRLFQRIRELKEQGVQLKAIKMLIPDLEQGETEITHLLARVDKLPAAEEGQAAAREEKMQQFQCIMSRLISEALEDHTERMGREISTQVSGHVIKEMDYLLRMKEEREDERFKRLDEAIRSSQKARKERAGLKKEEKKRWGFFGVKKGQAV